MIVLLNDCVESHLLCLGISPVSKDNMENLQDLDIVLVRGKPLLDWAVQRFFGASDSILHSMHSYEEWCWLMAKPWCECVLLSAVSDSVWYVLTPCRQILPLDLGDNIGNVVRCSGRAICGFPPGIEPGEVLCQYAEGFTSTDDREAIRVSLDVGRVISQSLSRTDRCELSGDGVLGFSGGHVEIGECVSDDNAESPGLPSPLTDKHGGNKCLYHTMWSTNIVNEDGMEALIYRLQQYELFYAPLLALQRGGAGRISSVC